MWKTFQLGYYERAAQIEAHFRGESPLRAAHQIGTAWMQRWQRSSWREVASMARWPHVALPHAVVVLVGAGMFAASLFGGLKL
jgi:hypothetical protein